MNWLRDIDDAIRCFEQGRVDVAAFDHAAHIRVAWSYLQRMEPYSASCRFTAALQRLTKRAGAEDKFHATVTGFFMFLIAERIAGSEAHDWYRFRSNNADLFADAAVLLAGHYTPERLQSPTAKSQFLLPDRGTAALATGA